MTDSNTPSVDPALDAPTTPPAPEATPTPATEAPPAPPVEVTPEIQKLIDDAAIKASKSANREAIAAKNRLKELEEAEQKRKDAELSEAEQLTKARDEAEARAAQATLAAQKALLRADVATHSLDLKIVDVDAALALMDTSNVTYTDDGKVEGVKEALAALAASKPYLVQAPAAPNLDPNNPGRGNQPDLTPAQVTANLYNRPPNQSIWG